MSSMSPKVYDFQLPFTSSLDFFGKMSDSIGSLNGSGDGVTIKLELAFLGLLSLIVFALSRVFHSLNSRSYLLAVKNSTSVLPRISGPTFQLPRLKLEAGSKMTMGLKRLDVGNWLTLDDAYFEEHALREKLFAKKHANVIQFLPGSEEACQEALDLVSDFLATRYPEAFTVNGSQNQRHIINHLTGEAFSISNSPRPLEIAARLCMEDFTILMKDEHDEHYHIKASATLFPAGWKLQERIGWSMAALHAPVPKWQETVGRHVDRYFDHITTKSSMERYNIFIQPNDILFHDTAETMLDYGPAVANPEQKAPLAASDMVVRRERQTFRRLPNSGAILFTVRTFMTPLIEMPLDEIPALEAQVDRMSSDMAKYKGKDIWGDVVLEFCRSKMAENGLEKRDSNNDS